MKKILALIMAALMLLSLSACSATEDTVAALVQGNLDEVYLGKFSEEYMELVDSSLEECEKDYEMGLYTEAETFCYYFSVEYPDDALMEEIVEMYKDIYALSKYTIGESSKLDSDTYVVQVEIYPIDVLELVDEKWDDGMAAFYEKYANADISTMSDEEYEAFDHDWARAIIALVYDQLPYADYHEPVSIAVQVDKNSDGYWMINGDDFYNIDEQIIYYP